MQTNIFFDIETETLPEQEIAHLAPEFTAPANYKDPEKIKASIQEQRAKWLADGALSAVTGRVICIGILTQKLSVFLGENDEDEQQIVRYFWEQIAISIQAGHQLVGFCCRTFDVPFLVRRSFRYGIRVPACIWEGRYLTSSIVDVADLWACGGRDPRDRISLDTLSQFLGVGAKNGDGKDFGALWHADRPAALKYLENDLALTKAAYERMTIP